MESTQKKVLVAMSGGVDSTVCAYLVKKKGFILEGMTMKLWSESETVADEKDPIPDQNCTDAKAVAEQLDIPHFSVAMGDTFRRTVIDNFISEYVHGRTPNPCIECNKSIKFGKLMTLALESGFDYLATGHYARIECLESGEYVLKKAKDLSKDQSYFLWAIKKDYLPKILFPLGDYTKAVVRDIAQKKGFVTAHRSDSQDICFIPNGDYASFIQKHSNTESSCGNFIALDGTVLGKHNGIINYTIGQRKGLGISLGAPAFVCGKNASDNTVTLCDNVQLFSRELNASHFNRLLNTEMSSSFRCDAKIRYRHQPCPATVYLIDDDRIRVVFDEPQRAITPGQSVVLYDKDIVIGGAIID